MVLFSVSHWLLADKYYAASVEMPYLVADVKVPSRKWCSRQSLNYTMVFLNVVASLACALSYWYAKNN